MTSLAQQVADGERVAQFLADPVIQEAFGRLEADYITRWKSSDRMEDRESCHAKARAIDDLKNELRAIVDNGERATDEVQRSR